ncbi:MAG: ABC transporter ATP-binding protein [Thermodesulfobacteriota bacterium]
MLSVEKLNKNFGGILALTDLSFDIEEKKITAIIGPNGAGKTTLLNIITGIYPATSGTIKFWNKMLNGLDPHHIAQLGIMRTFQNLQIFYNMTVLQNVMLGYHAQTKCEFLRCFFSLPSAKKEETLILDEAQKILEFFGLSNKSYKISGYLSYGDQKCLEIARAVASNPKLLLLDEPVAGLNPMEIEGVVQLLLGLKDKGVTVILVEHNMNFVMSISDKVIVLNYGSKISEGTPQEIQKDERVVAAYLGEEIC